MANIVATLALSAASAGCGLFDDDEVAPPLDSTGGDTDSDSAFNKCASEFDLSEVTCPFPSYPALTVTIEGDDILWIDDPSNGTTLGPGGWLFGTLSTADGIAWVQQGDRECGVACVTPPGHPCNQPGNLVCAVGKDEPSCFMCGPDSENTADVCVAALPFCAGDGEGMGGDNTTGSVDTGQVDSTGTGEEGAVGFDDTAFTTSPDLEWGTTQTLLDRLGQSAPANLTTDYACTGWTPQKSVTDRKGVKSMQKALLESILTGAQEKLGFCDGLRLRKTDKGIELRAFDRPSLAAALGMEQGDVITSLNGVPALDFVKLERELRSLLNADSATLEYNRGAKTLKTTILLDR